MRRLADIIKAVTVFLVILIAWDLVCRAGIWSAYVLPSPERVFTTMVKMSADGELAANIVISLRRVFIGFSIAWALAMFFGLLAVLAPKAAPFYKPLLNFVRHVPPLSIIPLMILWFGIGEAPKIIVIVLASFFPMLLNTDAGLAGCDPGLLEVGQTLGLSKARQFFKIMIPYSIPDILVGMRLGLGNSIKAIVGAEMIAAASGLGYMILDAQTMSRTDKVIVGIIVIGLIGLLLDWIFRMIIRAASKGRETTIR